MVAVPQRAPTLLTEQERDEFMVLFEDDTEEAPWMVRGDLQYWSASDFGNALRQYARAEHPEWYIACMLPILYTWPPHPRKRVVAPDVFVALAPDRPRQSFDIASEGGFPPFVLEVVSPSSVERDELEKYLAYDRLGAREYALFTPQLGGGSTLAGYRRDEAGRFVPWPPDDQGRLWSAVLGLYLVMRGPTLQAQLPDGRFLPTPGQLAEALAQSEAVRRQEALARQEAEAAREQEAAARREAEAEVARLRRDLARLRGEPTGENE